MKYKLCYSIKMFTNHTIEERIVLLKLNETYVIVYMYACYYHLKPIC